MRLAWYAGASTALAAGVVISAFHQRANFYSAMVYLYQSNLCLMILINLVFLAYSSFVYSLQRICFGQLRAVEVEQLYERAWFAITETCLAMTIFRDEFGGFFIVMFVSLLTGKVWGWIGEGRIEALEQQPPANPRLFHTRLIVSLVLSLVYDASLLYYAITTVIAKARPDMMVMFLFEFAVLLVTSLHTALRYSIILFDTEITKRQLKERLETRRREVREEREEILRRREAGEPDNGEPLPDEDDVEEMDIEVPGWEAKGQYVLGLDLWTDFTKVVIYAVFFAVLFYLYGLPLHIIRDLFMAVRSFIKRLGTLMKYRQAIKDMNRYADATEEDLARENTCIICREDMHVWNPNNPARIERSRPKKLPCGHILHLGCLKSWMERQQVCPTCRRSVVINDAANAAAAQRNADNVFRFNINVGGAGAGAGAGGPPAPGGGAGDIPGAGAGANGAPNGGPNPMFPGLNGQPPAAGPGFHDPHHPINHGHQQQPPPPAGNGRAGLRMFNLGPFRLGFAQGPPQDVDEIVRQFGLPQGGAIRHPAAAGFHGPPYAMGQGLPPLPSLQSFNTSTESISADLRNLEYRIERGLIELQIASEEVTALRNVLAELQRIRSGQPAPTPTTTAEATSAAVPQDGAPQEGVNLDTPTAPAPTVSQFSYTTTRTSSFTPDRNAPAIPAGSADLPEGVQIPAGWSLLPLRRLDGSIPAPAAEGSASASTSAPVTTGEATASAQASAPPSADDALEAAEATPAAAEPMPTTTSTTPPMWGGAAQHFGPSSRAAVPPAQVDSDTESEPEVVGAEESGSSSGSLR